ncbi:response regulator [Palleronia aestuarii]|uniref:response regulator n=1 Tax=Palleronia aestuarii TaxID=568105 RepID=UPI001473FF45|nr:response regulator [Palleronia aestuarii]
MEADQCETLADQPLRVMVVEDEALIAMDIEMILEGLGMEIVCRATSAADAVEGARKYSPDCVTMDINIHGERDGVSAAIEIYERFGIRSVFVSAFGNAETRERGARAHPVGWISKPFEADEIARVLGDFTGDI